MAEPVIKEVIKIHGGYTSYVDLKYELFNNTSNITRMARYRPITSHRQAFQKLARALSVKDKRCYLLTGAYGTGKSHLSLMFANYLQTPANEQPMPSFFEHYADADQRATEELKAKRSSGRYLIALCEWGGKADFEEVVLRAVQDALQREEFADALDTPYLQALKKIDEWKEFASQSNLKGHFYTDFNRELTERNPGLTITSFRNKLGAFDNTALEEFRRIHQAVTTAPFSQNKSDLLDILKDTLASKAFKERFLGILVLFDEFGYTMETGHMSPKTFQKFAQFCAETPGDCARIAFIGTAHKDLTDYARIYNAVDMRTASDRLESVPLTPDGVEDIISAIIVPQKDHPLWQQNIAPHSQTFDEMLRECKRLDLFSWLKIPKIREVIIENIYPMHPMATYALLQLARDVASNNRSVFTFFSDEAEEEGEGNDSAVPGSYVHYVARTPIETNGKLNLYTADILFEYFNAKLLSDNKELRETVREHVRNYESSVREQRRVAAKDSSMLLYQEDPLINRILRLILIYEIIQIPNTPENLQFGLYCTAQTEKTALKNRLQYLRDKGILYYLKDKNIYEFKQSTGIDLDNLVETYVRSPENMPSDIVAELNDLIPLGKGELYLEAKDYNLAFNEDKRLERRFVRMIDLSVEESAISGKRNFFEIREGEIAQEITTTGNFEGLAFYVVCETLEEIQKARDYCARNTSDRIVVAIPKQPVPLLESILELRALQFIEASKTADAFTIQDQSALNARLNGDSNRSGAKNALRIRRDKLLSGKEITWYGSFSQIIPVEENKPYDVANRVMETVYASYRNQFSHDDFNKLHIKIDRSRNTALRDAIDKLLDISNQIIIDAGLPQARGDSRYLQKCLLNQDVLTAKRSDQSKIRCEFEFNPQKYATKLPVLAEMVYEVQNLKPNEKIQVVDWIKRYRGKPYGQGPVSLALSLACLYRIFGDSIRFKREETALGDLPLPNFEAVFALLEGHYPYAFLSYRQLRPEEKALVNVVYLTFGQPDSAVTRDYSVVEAYNAIKVWWQSLPPLAHVAKLYSPGKHSYTADFIGAMQKIDAKDAHTFLFDELPTAFGADAGLTITQEIVDTLEQQLPQEKETLETGTNIAEQRIIEAVRSMFGVTQTTYSDILEAIRSWYNSLDTQQRDPIARWQNNDSKPLVLQLKSIETLQDTFLKKIPVSHEYGMKQVQDWMTDRIEEYVRRLERGKKLIDANRLKVDPATIEFEGDHTCPQEGQIRFKDQIRLNFAHANSRAKIYIAEGSSDPTDQYASREQIHEPLTIRANKTITIAVQDHEGNWSQPKTLQLINENAKYEIKLPPHKHLMEEMASIVFPTDPDAFSITCRSLFVQGLERKILTLDQLIEIMQALVEELKRGK